MRKPDALTVAKKPPVPLAGRDEASVQLVCLGLLTALVALACRIFSVW
jgi:hypothetical protein